MKNIIKTLTLLVSIVLATSCGHHQETTISLDNGKPWVSNPETTIGVNNMMLIMNDFTDKENVAAYATLKDELAAEFSFIIKECTMTGEAHNQLHNFLMPMKDLFNGIGSDDLTTCKTSFEKLHKHLTEYPKYFINE